MADVLALADEAFVSLTTFRRSGDPVATPVWVARDDDALVVTTGADSGKVKRLRRDGRVELRPCTRSGAVADDASTATGTAVVVETGQEGPMAAIRAKYGLQFRLIMLIERVARRGRTNRVILRITGTG